MFGFRKGITQSHGRGNFYKFRRDPIGEIGIGAMGAVFLPTFNTWLPEFWYGPGRPCGSLAVIEPPPRVAPQLLWPLGPGGIPANQNDFLAALANPTLSPDISNPVTYRINDPALEGLPENVYGNSSPGEINLY